MSARIHFSGPARYRLGTLVQLCRSILEVSIRRMLQGPRRPAWNWVVELGTRFLKRQLITAFTMRDVKESRRYLDSMVITLSVTSEMSIAPVVQEKFSGSWVDSQKTEAGTTLLYLHGGGYSFYPQAYANFTALIAQASKCKTFVLDYRLSPEHRFPAQLDDALHAYRWLLQNGTDPHDLVLAGDSAGGNLALALLLAARDSRLPLPALAIALSPATDFASQRASIVSNKDTDWIDERMLVQWADWFCNSTQRRDPLVSPLWAELHGLPPIYIQAGRAEILYDSIQAFADRAKSQGADVVLETWEDMNHDFQWFGCHAPQSAAALQRLGEVIDVRVRGRKKTETVSL